MIEKQFQNIKNKIEKRTENKYKNNEICKIISFYFKYNL